MTANWQPELMRVPMPTKQLGIIIKSARDIMRKDKGLSGELDRLPTLTWIMFLKLLDDVEQTREEEARLSGKGFQPAIEAPYRWRDWATNEGCMTGDELISFVNDEETTRPDGTRGPGLFAYLRRLQSAAGSDRRDVVASIFRGTANRMINGYLLRDVVDKVGSIDFASTDEIHTLGHLYESMLKEMRDAAGDSGEFYTPRPVVRFMVEAVDPRLSETVLDPACGTGGFLVEVYEHLEKQCETVQDRETLQRGSILGGEAKPLPYLMAQMNLLLHGIESPKIDLGNSLRYPLHEIGDEDRVDIVLTNPPFGGEEERTVQENFPQDKQTSDTALLFLQLIMSKLRRHPEPGRAGVIVPNGPLFATGAATRVKEELLRDFNLHTIVRLPAGVFAPYTGISTNLLLFDRSRPTEEVWYYEHPLPEGRKTYTKTKPIQFEEFSDLRAWWKNRQENVRSWKVSIADIWANGCNLDIKNPNRLYADHGDPEELRAAYQVLLTDMAQVRSALRRELTDVSERGHRRMEALFDNLELLTDEASGIEKLRELILRLAVSGRLVPQNPADESADLLLQKLEAEKGRLIMEKEIRKPEPLLQPAPDSTPFDVPKSWRWARLGEVGRVIGGGTPKTDHLEYYADEGIPWLTPADLYGLNGKYIGRGKRDISELGLKKSSARLLPEGSVLFSSRAPIGYVAIAANDLSTNQGFKSCIPFVMEMNQYIYYYLKFAAKEIDRRASGTTFKEVSGKEISLTMVPIPPLNEQRRIVAKVDRLMNLCDGLADRLKQAQLLKERLVKATAHYVLAE